MKKQVRKEELQNYVLQELISRKGLLTTGSMLAKKLGVTRSYIQKMIQELIEYGYQIESIRRSGYIYYDDTKVLNKEAILKMLKASFYQDILLLNQVDSTNNYAKKLAEEKKEGIVVIANYQDSGKGRLGRQFISRAGKGLYMSILLKPTFPIDFARRITGCVAVSVAKALEQLVNTKIDIKWVNDLYLHGKKICGILTEAVSSMEMGTLEYVIIGIGINLYQQDFPSNAGFLATSIEEETKVVISRNQLIATILNQIEEDWSQIVSSSYIEEYRNRCFVIGKMVELHLENKKQMVKVLDIGPEGELIVLVDNQTRAVYSGEIMRMVISNAKEN